MRAFQLSPCRRGSNRVEVIFVGGSGVGGGGVDHLLNRYNLPVEDIQFGGKAISAISQVPIRSEA